MVMIRRRNAGRDQHGHVWDEPGTAVDVPDDVASQLLAEPAVPEYSLIEPGATREVDGPAADHDEDDPDSPAGQHERATAIGSTPQSPRLAAPNDNRPASPNTPGSGKSDTLNAPGHVAADPNRTDVPQGQQADERDGGPNDIDKTTGSAGRSTAATKAGAGTRPSTISKN